MFLYYINFLVLSSEIKILNLSRGGAGVQAEGTGGVRIHTKILI